MTVTIKDAVLAYEERKRAGGADHIGMQSEERGRLILSGLGLDYEEIVDLKANKGIVAASYGAIAKGESPEEVFFGLWLDGIVTGIYFNRLAEKEKAEQP